jgi:hypothetical protein
MDLKTLSVRNRIEDHDVQTRWLETKEMLGDMGSKALPENPFVRFRDSMNGYALVRARFPGKVMSPYIYKASSQENTLSNVQAMLMIFSFSQDDAECDTKESSDEKYGDIVYDDDDGIETEEEEDIDDDITMNLDENLNDHMAPFHEPNLAEAALDPMPEPQPPNG